MRDAGTPTYDGLSLDKASSAIIASRMGQSGSFSTTFGAQTGLAVLPIRMFGTEDQKRRYLPKLVSGEHVGALNSADDLRGLVTSVRNQLGSDASVVALAADVQGKPAVIVATNEASRDAGLKAGALAKTAAGILGGGGGGKDDLAQGGGSDISAIPAALDAISAAVAG